MNVIVGVSVVAVLLGLVAPGRPGVAGFLACAVILFGCHVAANLFFVGFAGTDLEENLAYFNGSLMSYVGYNAQVAYRAFAPPLLCLACVCIFRLNRSR